MTRDFPVPVLLVGAGRLGGAIAAGWLRSAAIPPGGVLILDPNPAEAACVVIDQGAHINPPVATLAMARAVVLAIKPQNWRTKVEAIAPHLRPDAVIVSVMAGVRLADLQEAFRGHPVARAMPTTAVAVAQGAVSVFTENVEAMRTATALFAPISTVVPLPDEACLDAATAVSGSAPAYLYAFVEALAAAGQTVGLSAETSAELARSTIAGAAALMAESVLTPGELRAQVTSPGGTTQAAMDVLGPALGPLLRDAIRAAASRSKELAS